MWDIWACKKLNENLVSVREEKLDFILVNISNKLDKGAHTTVRFLMKDNSKDTANKENEVFLFGASRVPQGLK